MFAPVSRSSFVPQSTQASLPLAIPLLPTIAESVQNHSQDSRPLSHMSPRQDVVSEAVNTSVMPLQQFVAQLSPYRSDEIQPLHVLGVRLAALDPAVTNAFIQLAYRHPSWSHVMYGLSQHVLLSWINDELAMSHVGKIWLDHVQKTYPWLSCTTPMNRVLIEKITGRQHARTCLAEALWPQAMDRSAVRQQFHHGAKPAEYAEGHRMLDEDVQTTNLFLIRKGLDLLTKRQQSSVEDNRHFSVKIAFFLEHCVDQPAFQQFMLHTESFEPLLTKVRFAGDWLEKYVVALQKQLHMVIDMLTMYTGIGCLVRPAGHDGKRDPLPINVGSLLFMRNDPWVSEVWPALQAHILRWLDSHYPGFFFSTLSLEPPPVSSNHAAPLMSASSLETTTTSAETGSNDVFQMSALPSLNQLPEHADAADQPPSSEERSPRLSPVPFEVAGSVPKFSTLAMNFRGELARLWQRDDDVAKTAAEHVLLLNRIDMPLLDRLIAWVSPAQIEKMDFTDEVWQQRRPVVEALLHAAKQTLDLQRVTEKFDGMQWIERFQLLMKFYGDSSKHLFQQWIANGGYLQTPRSAFEHYLLKANFFSSVANTLRLSPDVFSVEAHLNDEFKALCQPTASALLPHLSAAFTHKTAAQDPEASVSQDMKVIFQSAVKAFAREWFAEHGFHQEDMANQIRADIAVLAKIPRHDRLFPHSVSELKAALKTLATECSAELEVLKKGMFADIDEIFMWPLAVTHCLDMPMDQAACAILHHLAQLASTEPKKVKEVINRLFVLQPDQTWKLTQRVQKEFKQSQALSMTQPHSPSTFAWLHPVLSSIAEACPQYPALSALFESAQKAVRQGVNAPKRSNNSPSIKMVNPSENLDDLLKQLQGLDAHGSAGSSSKAQAVSIQSALPPQTQNWWSDADVQTQLLNDAMLRFHGLVVKANKKMDERSFASRCTQLAPVFLNDLCRLEMMPMLMLLAKINGFALAYAVNNPKDPFQRGGVLYLESLPAYLQNDALKNISPARKRLILLAFQKAMFNVVGGILKGLQEHFPLKPFPTSWFAYHVSMLLEHRMSPSLYQPKHQYFMFESLKLLVSLDEIENNYFKLVAFAVPFEAIAGGLVANQLLHAKFDGDSQAIRQSLGEEVFKEHSRFLIYEGERTLVKLDQACKQAGVTGSLFHPAWRVFATAFFEQQLQKSFSKMYLASHQALEELKSDFSAFFAEASRTQSTHLAVFEPLHRLATLQPTQVMLELRAMHEAIMADTDVTGHISPAVVIFVELIREMHNMADALKTTFPDYGDEASEVVSYPSVEALAKDILKRREALSGIGKSSTLMVQVKSDD